MQSTADGMAVESMAESTIKSTLESRATVGSTAESTAESMEESAVGSVEESTLESRATVEGHRVRMRRAWHEAYRIMVELEKAEFGEKSYFRWVEEGMNMDVLARAASSVW